MTGMDNAMNDDLSNIVKQFQVSDKYSNAIPYGSGHINDTFLVTCGNAGAEIRYVLQRINHAIFKDPPNMMENIIRATSHIQKKLQRSGLSDVSRRVLKVIPTTNGKSYHKDPEGNYWRSISFIEGTVSYDFLETPQQAYLAARAFGQFQYHLADLPEPTLTETIPDFHNSPKRLQTFIQVLDKDPYDRACEARDEIGFVLKHASMCDVLIDLFKKGLIPERVTHNDTKINNVLFDKKTQEGICVIDLDTVMPGLSLYDFGDMVRTATCQAAEDERDLSKIRMDIQFFEHIARGYALETAAFLTDAEKEHLVFAGKLITFEQMIRFLTDHLNGDVYYKIHRPGHNLDRARTQMKLVQSIQDQEGQMHKLTDEIWNTLS